MPRIKPVHSGVWVSTECPLGAPLPLRPGRPMLARAAATTAAATTNAGAAAAAALAQASAPAPPVDAPAPTAPTQWTCVMQVQIQKNLYHAGRFGARTG